MFEQYGNIYHQNPSEVNNPSNNTFERIYQSLIDGILYMRQSDGTDIPLSSGLGPISSNVMKFQGGFSALAGIFPTTPLGSGPAGAIAIGDSFVITVAGVLGGIPVQVGDLIIARINNAGNVAGDWVLLEVAGSYVPYTGATANININNKTFTINAGGTVNGYMDFIRAINNVAMPAVAKTLRISSGVDGEFIFQSRSAANTDGFQRVFFGTLTGSQGYQLQDASGVLAFLSDIANVDTLGSATLVGGTVTVPTPAASSTSEIFLTTKTVGGVQGFLSYSNVIDGVSFDINSSSALDTSTISWKIEEPN